MSADDEKSEPRTQPACLECGTTDADIPRTTLDGTPTYGRCFDVYSCKARRARSITGDVHHRLTSIVDQHFGTRPTAPIEKLLDILEDELPGLAPQAREDALIEAAEQCASEKRACEKLVERFPKSTVHATGALIAGVCERRVRGLLGEDDADSEEAER